MLRRTAKHKDDVACLFSKLEMRLELVMEKNRSTGRVKNITVSD